MSDFTLVTMDAGGNVPPMLDLGRELLARGHAVKVVGHEQQRPRFETAGLRFEAYELATPWDATEQRSTLAGLRGLVRQFTESAKGTDVVRLAHGSDVVVVDCLLLDVLDAVHRAGLPTVCLVHSFWAYFDGPLRRGPVGLAARARGLGPRRVWSQADAVLVCTDRLLDPTPSGLEPARAVWTGPVQDAVPSAHGAGDTVLVSLSTTAFPGQPAALQRIVDGLAGLSAKVVVTTGPAIDPSSLRAAPGIAVHRLLPHEELLPDCIAVVCHGGHSTTARALSYGVPLVVMPMHPMLDQPMVGRAVAKAGAGVTVSKRARSGSIRDAVDTVLAGTHRSVAADIAARWRTAPPAMTVAADVVEATVR